MNYVFWIELHEGQRVEWRGLTERQAKTMYARTENRLPYNVQRYGWEQA